MQNDGLNHRMALRISLRNVLWGGCLAMVWMTATRNPAYTQYLRKLGMNEFYFGILSGLPMLMILFQFLGAFYNNRIQNRKHVFMISLISGRLFFLGVIIFPLIYPTGWPPEGLYLLLILSSAICSAMQSFGGPIWISWMADIIPQRVMNRYWGVRERWMRVTWMASFGIITWILFLSEKWRTQVPDIIMKVYPLLVIVGVTAGVIDLLLFFRVNEPGNERVTNKNLWNQFIDPLVNPQFRNFLLFSCSFQAAVMFAAPFMGYYLLKVLNIPVWQAAMIAGIHSIGGAVMARTWGEFADRYGHRPVMTVCVFLKPVIPLVYLFLTRDNIWYILPPFLLFDGILNSGKMIAGQGYVLTMTPRPNRSMYSAAVTGFAGICAGLATMAGGTLLDFLHGVRISMPGNLVWGPYHIVFLLSFAFRCLSIVLAQHITEPKAAPASQVVEALRTKVGERVAVIPRARG